MQVSIMQLSCQEGDIAFNMATIKTAWSNTPASSDILVFPELMLTGFAETNHTHTRALSIIDCHEIAELCSISQNRNQAAVIGLLENDEGKVYNTTLFITPETGIAAKFRKVHLWDTEQVLISAGNHFVNVNWRGIQWGIITCFDIEFPESARYTASLGCEILLVCDGNMDPYVPVHRLSARARAMENQIFVCLANRVGEGMGLNFSGHSLVCSPNGHILNELGEDSAILTVNLDLTQITQSRHHYHYLKQRRKNYQGKRISQSINTVWEMTQ